MLDAGWHTERRQTILQMGTLGVRFPSAGPAQDSGRWRVLPHAASGRFALLLDRFRAPFYWFNPEYRAIWRQRLELIGIVSHTVDLVEELRPVRHLFRKRPHNRAASGSALLIRTSLSLPVHLFPAGYPFD